MTPTADSTTNHDTARDRIHPYRLARRVWVLCLLDAAEQAGLTPISSEHFHRLAFLANCLSPAYELEPIDGKIYKYRSGPLYPDVQWDLDRMAVQGLSHVQGIRQLRTPTGVTLFVANYSMLAKGIHTLASLVKAPQARRQYQFLLEVAAAFGSLHGDSQETAALNDATYNDPDIATGDIIDFAEWQNRNFSVKTTESFDKLVPYNLPLGKQDRLYLYFRYLDRLVGAHA